ncbi:hypothetical protein PYH37_000137 [Sinorhizobium numidicum]|uniref:Phospholipid methyltransferase n=1 Tax=Sinorhizobium numidicum TaxID=680248 RepID=A0ABY8CTP3_9HYPH|nr:hypothetical protein [Sinorhizobium numidicum]WEX74843.1 hypothetical protein PYH37_000137 [Sinorhizobium numidicum]WEX80837.1 hypothetical protein PYH38_000139 [Sinorhizobium numidicum]
MIHFGNFLFRYRNLIFPLLILSLFVTVPPPGEIWASTTLERIKDVIVILFALSGLALRATVIGYAYIQRGGLKKKVYAKKLVTEGMFGICRNPLYVGNVLIYATVSPPTEPASLAKPWHSASSRQSQLREQKCADRKMRHNQV